ncbi:hypothetical protein AAVH_07509 [Aphelenchoides avenae]|nr:hypothetical protein AAVH_07509 [Aphelenchus avenae]
MPKRPKNSDDSFQEKIAKIIQFKEECLALIKRYDEEGVALDSAGERRILQLQKWRGEMVQTEEYLARHIQYEDAEYDADELQNSQTKIVIYETGLEPLNALLTRFINVRQEDGGYSVLHPHDVDLMIRKIKKRNECLLVDAIVPKDPERYC